MKQEGLRVGQAPGAVVKDGGQSNLLFGQYTSSCVKNQIKKEVIMNDDGYESTGIDPYEDDTEADELPEWGYRLILGIVMVIIFLMSPFAWLKR